MGSEMNTTRRKALIAATVVLLCIVGGWIVTKRYWLPSFPNTNGMSSAPLEVRKYDAFTIPREGKDVSAIWRRIQWHVINPGQVRLHEVARASGVKNLQSCLEELGYEFPPGTYAQSGDVVPGWRICHHASVLDHLEEYLDLQPKASTSSLRKP